MEKVGEHAIGKYFSELKDKRINRKKLYPLQEILLLVFTATICGAESFREMVCFGEEKIDTLKSYYQFENGIPSKNTISRVLSMINPKEFGNCFMRWINDFQSSAESFVAIDGKTLRRSFDKSQNKLPLHLVSAFATKLRLVLGQVKVKNKSNEITAIPELLKILDLQGAIISIDAMGCQKNIAAEIVSKKADYVLALKGNQISLHKDVLSFFENETKNNLKNVSHNFYKETDGGHGRIEIREHWITSDIAWLKKKHEWKNLKSIIMVKRTRIKGDKEKKETCFFITSLPADAQQVAHIIRSHWSIENSLHWVLDVVFNEDQSRIRDENAAQNMAIIRRLVLNTIRREKSKHKKDMSIKGLKKKAGWSSQTLHDLLAADF